MKITVDITHPAHFHFFKNAIQEWLAQGHDVQLLARDKDITLQLLNEVGWDYQLLSQARRGLLNLTLELVEHSYKVWQALRRHESQVVVAIAGTFIVYGARLCNIPALVFYDTEHAKLSNRLTYPLATRIYTPRSYRDNLGAKQQRYNGFQELAYLHPKRFLPQPEKLAIEGLEVGEPFTFVRLVSWDSHHDIHDYGVQNPHKIVETLSRYGRVLISAEVQLPDDLKVYQRKGASKDVHHILAHARLCFGESATMASEAAQLGVPAIFLSSSSRGYTDELESRYQMMFNFNGENALEDKALACAEAILSEPESVLLYQERHAKLMSEQIDVTAFIMEEVARYAGR